ncbi:MAG: sensor histidine kinase, partial [Gemmatimonadaceae bacterium]
LEHVVPEDREHVDAAFGTALRTHTAWDFTCRIHRADGSERWIMGRGEPADDQDGRPARLLGVVRDVTAERHAESALRAAKEGAEAANVAKSDFLASMSHELRTPLNAIGGYTELISLGIRGPVTEQQAEDLARIQRSQQHLLGLINDVLNVVRLDAGQIPYDMDDVPLGLAMTLVEELILPQLKAKGLAYEHVPCDPTILVRADEEKLRQVLVNLLTNATKFTDSGRIDFSCDVEPDVVHIHVRDTGAGIPADHLDRIFEPFVQVARKLNRPAEGVGLGLAISRDLARGMGGDLTVRSTVDSGSTFTLTIPRSVPAEP